MSNSLVLKEEISYLHGSYSFSLRILGHDVLCITHLKVPIKIVGTQQDTVMLVHVTPWILILPVSAEHKQKMGNCKKGDEGKGRKVVENDLNDTKRLVPKDKQVRKNN